MEDPTQISSKPSLLNKVFNLIGEYWIVLFAAAFLLLYRGISEEKAAAQLTDTPTLVQALLTFCGSEGSLYCTDTQGDPLKAQSSQMDSFQARKAACAALLKEAGDRGLKAQVSFGSTIKTISFNETTLDMLMQMRGG